MSKRKTKSDRQIEHAKRRSRQRYGISLSDYDYLQIVKLIQDDKAEFLEHQTQRVAVYKVEYKGDLFIAVYDQQRENICTFLPDAYLENLNVGSKAGNKEV